MSLIKYLLLIGGAGMIGLAGTILACDLHQAMQCDGPAAVPSGLHRWRGSLALGLLAWGPILLAVGMLLVASGVSYAGRSL